MGRKGHQIDEKIKNKLNEDLITELTYNDLYKSVKNDNFKDLDKDKYKYSFIRHLNGYLNSGEIEISGYDIDKDRKKEQKFVPDYILLRWSERKTRPDIQQLLEKMNLDNKSYHEIKALFKEKLKKLNEFHNDRWLLLNEWTLSYSHTEIKEKLSNYQYYNEINDVILNLNKKEINAFIERHYGNQSNVNNELANTAINAFTDLQSKIHKKEIKTFYPFSKYLKFKINYNNIVLLLTLANRWEEESPEYKIFFFPVSLDEYNNVFFDIHNKIISSELYPKNKINPVIATWNMTEDYSFTDKEFILSSEKYSKTNINLDDANLIFERFIDIIYTYPNEEKKVLMGILAKGLSDEPDSIKVFAEFFKKMNSINYPERLDNILGVVSEDYKVK